MVYASLPNRNDYRRKVYHISSNGHPALVKEKNSSFDSVSVTYFTFSSFLSRSLVAFLNPSLLCNYVSVLVSEAEMAI